MNDRVREVPRILVVDDEDIIALLIAELLSELHYEVETVYNGRDAIAAVMRDPPDLLISDVMMPFASGLEVLEEMRKREQTRDIPVILMSAAVDPRINDDQVMFIPKPFNIQSMVDAVSRTITARRQRRRVVQPRATMSLRTAG